MREDTKVGLSKIGFYTVHSILYTWAGWNLEPGFIQGFICYLASPLSVLAVVLLSCAMLNGWRPTNGL